VTTAVSAHDALLAKAVAWFTEHGVGDTSLRTLAAELGTSHRMLHYHFGSRDGLLVAVVEAVERAEKEILARLLDEHDDPYSAGATFWEHVADSAQTFAPLYFELAGHAMLGHAWARSLREWLTDGWVEALTKLYVSAGHPPVRAAELARMSLAMARGLTFELALTGDRAAVDAAMAAFTESTRAGREIGGRPA